MFNTKQLSDDQVTQIREWAANGAQLSDIQKMIQNEFKMQITYMDTRFAILDLGIELSKVSAPEKIINDEPLKIATGSVEATVTDIERPGALKSGNVTFSDGEKATWIIDHQGRLSIDPSTADYQASEEDLIKFQEQLRDLLA